MEIIKQNENYIEIKLDNGNTISLTEVESGTVQFENTTQYGGRNLPHPRAYGLNLYPIGYSVIAITPEG